MSRCSTKLDAEKRLALQEEKQTLEAKLLEVSVFAYHLVALTEDCLPTAWLVPR